MANPGSLLPSPTANRVLGTDGSSQWTQFDAAGLRTFLDFVAQVQSLIASTAPASHTHAISEITDLQTQLDALDARLDALEAP
jgi:hypothetical protein